MQIKLQFLILTLLSIVIPMGVLGHGFDQTILLQERLHNDVHKTNSSDTWYRLFLRMKQAEEALEEGNKVIARDSYLKAVSLAQELTKTAEPEKPFSRTKWAMKLSAYHARLIAKFGE